jgi:hypothetical protein
MHPKYLFLVAALLLALALTLIAIGWNGTAGVTFSSPIAGSSFKFCGEAKGGWAVGGMLSAIAAIIVFLVAVVRSLLELTKRGHRGDASGLHGDTGNTP